MEPRDNQDPLVILDYPVQPGPREAQGRRDFPVTLALKEHQVNLVLDLLELRVYPVQLGHQGHQANQDHEARLELLDPLAVLVWLVLLVIQGLQVIRDQQDLPEIRVPRVRTDSPVDQEPQDQQVVPDPMARPALLEIVETGEHRDPLVTLEPQDQAEQTVNLVSQDHKVSPETEDPLDKLERQDLLDLQDQPDQLVSRERLEILVKPDRRVRQVSLGFKEPQETEARKEPVEERDRLGRKDPRALLEREDLRAPLVDQVHQDKTVPLVLADFQVQLVNRVSLETKDQQVRKDPLEILEVLVRLVLLV